MGFPSKEIGVEVTEYLFKNSKDCLIINIVYDLELSLNLL